MNDLIKKQKRLTLKGAISHFLKGEDSSFAELVSLAPELFTDLGNQDFDDLTIKQLGAIAALVSIPMDEALNLYTDGLLHHGEYSSRPPE